MKTSSVVRKSKLDLLVLFFQLLNKTSVALSAQRGMSVWYIPNVKLISLVSDRGLLKIDLLSFILTEGLRITN
jgi:hypothetical protein